MDVMAGVTIRACAPDDSHLQRFLDAEWPLVEPPPWITRRAAFVAERDGAVIGAARDAYTQGWRISTN